jgi:hypothetical protein
MALQAWECSTARAHSPLNLRHSETALAAIDHGSHGQQDEDEQDYAQKDTNTGHKPVGLAVAKDDPRFQKTGILSRTTRARRAPPASMHAVSASNKANACCTVLSYHGVLRRMPIGSCDKDLCNLKSSVHSL